jgi:hypothetical protein
MPHRFVIDLDLDELCGHPEDLVQLLALIGRLRGKAGSQQSLSFVLHEQDEGLDPGPVSARISRPPAPARPAPAPARPVPAPARPTTTPARPTTTPVVPDDDEDEAIEELLNQLPERSPAPPADRPRPRQPPPVLTPQRNGGGSDRSGDLKGKLPTTPNQFLAWFLPKPDLKRRVYATIKKLGWTTDIKSWSNEQVGEIVGILAGDGTSSGWGGKPARAAREG